VQGTAEAEPFDRDELNRLLEMALDANKKLAEVQRLALGETLEIR
jgi:ribonuclease PH